MTRKEFEDRTGLEVTALEFSKVHDIYMAAGEMDKDTFCSEWKQHGESELIAELWNTAKREHDLGMHKKEECDKLYSERWELVDFLLERAQKFGDIELLKKAIDIITERIIINICLTFFLCCIIYSLSLSFSLRYSYYTSLKRDVTMGKCFTRKKSLPPANERLSSKHIIILTVQRILLYLIFPDILLTYHSYNILCLQMTF